VYHDSLSSAVWSLCGSHIRYNQSRYPLGREAKMAEDVGSELVALISDHLSKVKQALHSRSNMDRTMKEEAIHSVSEIDTMLNRLSGMFQGLESMLKTLTAEDKTRLYSELAASHGPTANQSKRAQIVASKRHKTPNIRASSESGGRENLIPRDQKNNKGNCGPKSTKTRCQ